MGGNKYLREAVSEGRRFILPHSLEIHTSTIRWTPLTQPGDGDSGARAEEFPNHQAADKAAGPHSGLDIQPSRPHPL